MSLDYVPSPHTPTRGKNCTHLRNPCLCAAFAESGHSSLSIIADGAAAREIKITYKSCESIKARRWWNIFSWSGGFDHLSRLQRRLYLIIEKLLHLSQGLVYIVARTSLFNRDECRVNGLAPVYDAMTKSRQLLTRFLTKERASLRRDDYLDISSGYCEKKRSRTPLIVIAVLIYIIESRDAFFCIKKDSSMFELRLSI